MRLFFITLLMLLDATAQGDPLPKWRVIRIKESLYLAAHSCDALQEQANALMEWKKKVDETPGKTPDCRCAEGACVIGITEIAPKFIADKHNQCSEKDGPNCFNSALVNQKIIPAPRFADGEEMDFWIKSPLCTERPMSENPQPGDIVVIRKQGRPVHAFTHISNSISFTKNGWRMKNPYLLATPDSVFDLYGVETSCRRLKESSSDSGKCGVYASYYNCETVERYQKQHPEVAWEKYFQVSERAGRQECVVATPLGTSNRQMICDSITALGVDVMARKISLMAALEKTKDEKKREKIKSELVLWNGLDRRVSSCLDQVISY